MSQESPTDGELALGLDIGGTNLRAALYRGLRALRDRRSAEDAAPAPLATHRELVGDGREPTSLARRIAQISRDLVGPTGADPDSVPIGVGIAAMLRGQDGMVANSPHLHWRRVPFGDILRRELGADRPLALHNDANAITYGEYSMGAGVGARDLLAVYVGTGIGSGIIANGQLLTGASNCAGELGHFKVAWGDDAPECECGMRGCVETFIGGKYLQARIRRELAAGAPSAAIALAGGDAERVHVGHIDRAAAQGDSYALDLYAEIAPPFAASLGNALSLLNSSRLVLGGGVLSRAPVLRVHVVAALELTATRAVLDPVSVVDAALGDDAGLVGGALLAAEAGAKPAG